MSYPLFRLRTVMCALSVCVLSACGGGGDDLTGDAAIFASDGNAELAPRPDQIIVLKTSTDTVQPRVYQNAVTAEGSVLPVGPFQVGYSTLTAEALTIALGYPKGAKDRFVIQIEVKGSTTVYQCVSGNWTAEERQKAGADTEVCGNGITFDGLTNQLRMVKASVWGPVTTDPAKRQRITVNVQTTLPEAVFPE
jgi:hypothetical protein